MSEIFISSVAANDFNASWYATLLSRVANEIRTHDFDKKAKCIMVFLHFNGADHPNFLLRCQQSTGRVHPVVLRQHLRHHHQLLQLRGLHSLRAGQPEAVHLHEVREPKLEYPYPKSRSSRENLVSSPISFSHLSSSRRLTYLRVQHLPRTNSVFMEWNTPIRTNIT